MHLIKPKVRGCNTVHSPASVLFSTPHSCIVGSASYFVVLGWNACA